MKELTKEGLRLDENHFPAVNVWLRRGDGIAVYENANLGSLNGGHRKFVSFGSPQAQLETDNPPQRLPDMGGSINWAYQLVGAYQGKLLA